jgi:hypothetical protein
MPTVLTRPSRHLRENEARRVIDAACFAVCIGRPLNRHITIHLNRAKVSCSHSFITRFLKHAGDWLRYRADIAPHYVWVLENPPGGGLNVHILIHVPTAHVADFNRAQRRWIKMSGALNRPGVLRSSDIWYSDFSRGLQPYLCDGLWGILKYLLKGLAPESAERLGIAPQDEGPVHGKRSGCSEALGPARRWVQERPRPASAVRFSAASRMRHFIRHTCPELAGCDAAQAVEDAEQLSTPETP